MEAVSLIWTVSAAGEQEKGGKELRLSNMWKHSAHLEEEKSDLKGIGNIRPS